MLALIIPLLLASAYHCQGTFLEGGHSGHHNYVRKVEPFPFSRNRAILEEESCDGSIRDVFCGQDDLVGGVKVEEIEGGLKVTLQVDADAYCLSEYHMHLSGEPPPPAPGQFDRKEENWNDWKAEETFEGLCLVDESLYIAVHAVVHDSCERVDLVALHDALPESGKIVPYYNHEDSYGYWYILFLNTALAGNLYHGWCVDTSHYMTPGKEYSVEVMSSYPPDDIPDGIVDYPHNFTLVNYLINNYPPDTIVDQNATGCDVVGDHKVTTFEHQRALWELIENAPNSCGSCDMCIVNHLVTQAMENGVGYEPTTCDDHVAILLIPRIDDTIKNQVIIAQVTIIEVENACGCIPCPHGMTETAWATGDEPLKNENGNGKVGGGGWGTYWSCGCNEDAL